MATCIRTASFVFAVCALLLVAAATPAAAAVADTSPAATDATVDADDGEVNATQANGTTVTTLSYNDIQTAIAQNGTTPRLASLVDERRAAHDNPTFLFGAGDQVSPHSLAPISAWRTPVDVLNELELDAEVVGNHDLDYGFDAVENVSAESQFPWLLANVVDTETGDPVSGTEPYTVVEQDGVKVDVVGLVDEKIKSKTAVDFAEQGYELQDYNDVGSEYATKLKEEENVDVVVALGHFAVPVAKDLAANTEHVDVVLVGDDEIEYAPQETDGVVISEAEARAEFLGELNLTVENGEVTDWNGRLIPTTENVTKDENVSDIISTARGEQLSKVAGETETDLDARFASNYHDETALGNLVTDAARWQTGADVAVTNAGGIRSNAQYGTGDVTAGDVFSMLPFNNHLVTMELTGEQLETVLQSQVVTLQSETGQQYGAEAQLQVSGVTYEWLGQEADDNIRSLYVNGEPVDTDATYTVTVNSYMSGWDGSPLANATRTDIDYTMYGEVFFDYIEAEGTVAPDGENRIRRIDYETDAGSLELDGEGAVTVSFDAPTHENGTVVDTTSLYALTSTNERVNATSADVDDGEVTVRFSDGDLRSLAENGDVEVYGEYVVDQPPRPYFDAWVLNAEVDASLVAPTTTVTATTDATTEATTEAPATTTAGDESGGGAPGFGITAAVVAALGAAVLATRRA